MGNDETKPEEVWESKFYFDLKSALGEVQMSIGAKETALSSAKLVGKSVFNVGLFAGKIGVEVIKELPAHMLKQNARNAARALKEQPNLPQEKRELLQSIVDRAKE